MDNEFLTDDKQNLDLEESAVKRPERHHSRGERSDRFFMVRNILNIINLIGSWIVCWSIVAIPSIIMCHIAGKQLKAGKPTIVVAILVFILAGNPVLFGIGAISGILMLVSAILSKKLAPADEYAEETEELVEE